MGKYTDTTSMDALETAPTQLAAAQQGNQIATLMLKKSQDINEQQAMKLVQSANLPNQGQGIDVRA